MPLICCVVPPPACWVQVDPLVVASGTSLRPTVVHVVAFRQVTPARKAPPALPVVAVQVPLASTSTVPFWPVATHAVVLVQLTLFSTPVALLVILVQLARSVVM